ncbi:hypothetical protein [Anaeromyxobacter oryzae]|uniref:Uncharacterized protein n=1 Tax=Anaeromyxobacter oryzae TaxID=2918170 RepID=A0ABN6MUL9_9BACT|nr:hypothetical protein [Anaeromyxobacter oryzae]BDG03163.1 hypothetical protein AMOR_21590 [Anaeromyxobacter oryzae]
MGRPDVATLERLLAEQLAGVPLTRVERAEALCMALGLEPALSAAVSGRAAATVRARRRRIVEKLVRAAAARRGGRPPP